MIFLKFIYFAFKFLKYACDSTNITTNFQSPAAMCFSTRAFGLTKRVSRKRNPRLQDGLSGKLSTEWGKNDKEWGKIDSTVPIKS